jgi:hypothetical protein
MTIIAASLAHVSDGDTEGYLCAAVRSMEERSRLDRGRFRLLETGLLMPPKDT